MVFHLEFKPKHKASIYLILIILCFVNMSCIKKINLYQGDKMIMKIQKKAKILSPKQTSSIRFIKKLKIFKLKLRYILTPRCQI